MEKLNQEQQARETIVFYLKMKSLGYRIADMTYDAVSNDGFELWVKKLARFYQASDIFKYMFI